MGVRYFGYCARFRELLPANVGQQANVFYKRPEIKYLVLMKCFVNSNDNVPYVVYFINFQIEIPMSKRF